MAMRSWPLATSTATVGPTSTSITGISVLVPTRISYGQSLRRGFRDVGLGPLHRSFGGYQVHATGDFNGDGRTDVYLNYADLGAGANAHIWYGAAGTRGFNDVSLGALHPSWSGYRVVAASAPASFNLFDGSADLFLARVDANGAYVSGPDEHFWFGRAGFGGFEDLSCGAVPGDLSECVAAASFRVVR